MLCYHFGRPLSKAHGSHHRYQSADVCAPMQDLLLSQTLGLVRKIILHIAEVSCALTKELPFC